MPATEFSRPIPLARIGSEPVSRELAATPAECEALARRFGLLGLDRLEASVELCKQTDGTVLMTASFEASFAQECVVTLEPVESMLAENFTLRFGRPELEPEELEADDGPAFEPIEGDTIDLGEAVAQEFSLALPPFPRSPGAEDPAIGDPDSEAISPFSDLSRLLNQKLQ